VIQVRFHGGYSEPGVFCLGSLKAWLPDLRPQFSDEFFPIFVSWDDADIEKVLEMAA
jgi:hypothetical protein